MKIAPIILLFICFNASAINRWCKTPANGGNDGNTGTLASPYATWQKLASVLNAGDTGWIGGGTYVSALAQGASDWICTITGRNGTSVNPIVISALPNEQPIFDFTGFNQTNNTTAVRINNCSWMKFYGLLVFNMVQNANGNIIAGWDIHDSNNMYFEICAVDRVQGAGFRQAIGCDNFTFINCDASRCGDPINTGGGVYGNADGFDSNYGTATYKGCRAWWNSDDGFDTFFNDSTVTYDSCWSFWNGYIPGTFNDPGPQADGMGFKWGTSTTPQPTQLRRIYTRCISFQNKAFGYDQNAARIIAEFFNCTSYNNRGGGWATGYSISPRIANVLRNNISYADPVAVSDLSGLTQDHNTWNGLPASPASFASLDTSGVQGVRTTGGALPVLAFLHLSAGSNMIDQGVNVGLPFSGSAPDLGAYEFSSAATITQVKYFGIKI